MNYLLDVNVPDGISRFQSSEFYTVKTLGLTWSDQDIWQYALQMQYTIVTKDTDFFHRAMAANTAPKIVQLKIGNMRLKDFEHWIEQHWNQIERLIEQYQLVIAHPERIEAINEI